ncbi:MAG: hypothetical protein AAB358_02950 [Patescibacteria group bacterium]
MDIVFNADFAGLWQKFLVFGSQNPAIIATEMFKGGGWVVFLMVFTWGLYQIWLEARQIRCIRSWQQVFLAIDIPKNNEQTPKAVENVFTALSGSLTGHNFLDKYWFGKRDEFFSFELVSLEGYVQFLVRTPAHFRDLVEASIYAQYPEAEITEVEDYAAPYKDLPFPNDKYNLWGSELVLIKDYPYPIRTYPEFEHTMTQQLIDPMADLLEVLSRVGPGEQVWLQLVVSPQQPPGWGEVANKVLQEKKGQEYKPPETFLSKAVYKPIDWLGTAAMEVANQILTSADEEGANKKDEADQFRMMRMAPRERTVFENIERKLSKHAFRVKFRLIYLGERDVFKKGRGVGAVIGAIQQFNAHDSNGFKPGKKTKTSADYFFVARRVAKKQKRILQQYIQRNNWSGDRVENMFLNSEELASIWHFPVITVKAPSVEKAGAKKAVPPTRLPYERRLAARLLEMEKESAKSEPVGLPAKPKKPRMPEVGEEAYPKPVSGPREAAVGYVSETTRVKRPAPPSNLPTV